MALLIINPELFNEESSFSMYLYKKVRSDFAKSNQLDTILTKIKNTSSYSDLFNLLSKLYDGIYYDKIKWSFEDLPLVLDWVQSELNLPTFYENSQVLYMESKYKNYLKRKNTYDQQVQERKIARAASVEEWKKERRLRKQKAAN